MPTTFESADDPGLEEAELPGEREEREGEANKKEAQRRDKLQRWLRQACIDGNQMDVEKILGMDANALHYTSASGTTALHEAVYHGNMEITEFLLEKGAEVNQLDTWSSNPLHFAASQGHEEITMLLVERGCKMNHIRQDGKAPIHLAKEKGHDAVLQFLYHEMLARQNVAQRQSNWQCALCLGILAGIGGLAFYLLEIPFATPFDVAEKLGL